MKLDIFVPFLFALAFIASSSCKRHRADIIDNSNKDRINPKSKLSPTSNAKDSPLFDGIELKFEGIPVTPSQAKALDIKVKSEIAGGYVFKFGRSDDLSCSDPYNYVVHAIDDPIKEDLSGLPDGEIGLCVLSMSKSQVWQRLSEALRFSWVKNTGALASATNLTATPAAATMSLAWSRSPDNQGFVIARSDLGLNWAPADGKTYGIGDRPQLDIEIVYVGNELNFVDKNLIDGKSYHYGVFAYNQANRFAPPAKISAIPGAAAYAWLKPIAGSYLKNAVIGGMHEDGSKELYVCRSPHFDAANKMLGIHPGKFVPDVKGILSSGKCSYSFDQAVFSSKEFELLVVTRGRVEDVFTWLKIATTDPFPTLGAFKVSDDFDAKLLYSCRYESEPNKYYVLGKSFGNGCHSMAATTQTLFVARPNYEILIQK